MATRVRESGLRGKEKKGNQADNTMPQQHKRITTTTTTTTSRLMSSNSSSSIASSVPNYLRPTTASSAVQAAGDKPSPARRKSLDRPLSHLDTHRNLAGDKPSPARRKSLDRPIQPLHSPLSSPSSSCSSTSSLPYKPTFSRTKSSLDRPKSSTAMSRTSEANDRRGKIMTRSISSVSKSSSIAHNHHLKTTPNKTQKNSTRKQPGNTTLSSKPIKKKPTETILTTNHPHEPSVPILQSADHHKPEASATPNSNQTEINNNNNNSKTVQEKENIIVVVSSDHEELEDLKSIEDCSSLSSVLEDPPIDPEDTITEGGDAEAISVPENLQESGQTQSADTMPHTTPEDPKVEDKAGGEINNLKETTPADPKPADEVSVEEKGDETMHDNNCSENKAENQEEGEEEEREKEKDKDKKADNHHIHQEVAEEEVKEMTDDQSNNNNNNNNNNVVQQPETNKPALKRNESVVSNDVIEETASKLREQRKNKVKALAGAFETVISLQDK